MRLLALLHLFPTQAFLLLVQAVRPHAIVDLIHAGETMRVPLPESGQSLTVPGKCERCGCMSSQAVCKACVLLEGLNKGLANYGIGRVKLKENR